jgi:preprotein translocase subunit YajC
MFDFLTFVFPLFGQEVPAVPVTNPPTDSSFGILIFMLPFFLLLYWFFMLRPQQRQEDRQRKMWDSLEKNDKVLTVGGIIATVHSVDKEKNEIILKVDDSSNTKIKFFLSAITSVFPKEDEKTTDGNALQKNKPTTK